MCVCVIHSYMLSGAASNNQKDKYQHKYFLCSHNQHSLILILFVTKGGTFAGVNP
jgi:hypothetical protein